MPVFFSPGMADHPCLILRATSLSLQGDPANIGKDDPGPPVDQGDRGSVWDPRTLERAGQ
jgi:hypothetical protein